MAKVVYHRKRSHSRSRRRKSSRRRHRRVGAIALNPSSSLVRYGSIAAGYFLSDAVNSLIDKTTGGKIDSRIVAGGELILGAMLVFGKGRKGLLKTVAGGVLLGAGAKKGLKALNVISGYGAVPVIGNYGNVPVISGYNAPGTLAGYSPNASLNGNKKPSVVGSIDSVESCGLVGM